MRDRHFTLYELEARARGGDAGADEELRRRLEPILGCLVRRILCLPSERSWLRNLVQAEIGQLVKRRWDEKVADDRSLVAQIAIRIAGTVMPQLRAGIGPPPTYLETIQNWSVPSLPLDTCNRATSSPIGF
jgi:hypothetical protein